MWDMVVFPSLYTGASLTGRLGINLYFLSDKSALSQALLRQNPTVIDLKGDAQMHGNLLEIFSLGKISYGCHEHSWTFRFEAVAASHSFVLGMRRQET
jgi:hypothetical protein